MEAEEWRDIPGFPGYKVSSFGKILGLRGTLLSPGRTQSGHLTVGLRIDGRSESKSVHSLVGLAFLGPREKGQVMRHLDGNAQNNHYSNLKYGTYSENSYDAVRHGTHYPGNKTHCPAGHEYDQKNTLVSVGRRHCRTCQAKAHYKKRHAGVPDGDPRHGSLNGYGRGCRCQECYLANSMYQKEYKERKRRENDRGN